MSSDFTFKTPAEFEASRLRTMQFLVIKRPWLDLYGVYLKPVAPPGSISNKPFVDSALLHRTLPDELLFEVFARLTPYSLGRAACVCRKWRYSIRNPVFWRNACLKAWQFSGVMENYKVLQWRYECSWWKMWLLRPRLRIDGIYVSRNTYIRAGVAEWNITNPVHLVCYYRYLRFYPSGRFLYKNSSHKIKDAAKYLNFRASKADSVFSGHYTLSDDKVESALLYPGLRSTVLRIRLRLRGTTTGANNRLDILSLLTSGLNDTEVNAPNTDILQLVQSWEDDETHNPDVPAVSHKRGLSPFVFVPFEEGVVFVADLMGNKNKKLPIPIRQTNSQGNDGKRDIVAGMSSKVQTKMASKSVSGMTNGQQGCVPDDLGNHNVQKSSPNDDDLATNEKVGEIVLAGVHGDLPTFCASEMENDEQGFDEEAITKKKNQELGAMVEDSAISKFQEAAVNSIFSGDHEAFNDELKLGNGLHGNDQETKGNKNEQLPASNVEEFYRGCVEKSEMATGNPSLSGKLGQVFPPNSVSNLGRSIYGNDHETTRNTDLQKLAPSIEGLERKLMNKNGVEAVFGVVAGNSEIFRSSVFEADLSNVAMGCVQGTEGTKNKQYLDPSIMGLRETVIGENACYMAVINGGSGEDTTQFSTEVVLVEDWDDDESNESIEQPNAATSKFLGLNDEDVVTANPIGLQALVSSSSESIGGIGGLAAGQGKAKNTPISPQALIDDSIEGIVHSTISPQALITDSIEGIGGSPLFSDTKNLREEVTAAMELMKSTDLQHLRELCKNLKSAGIFTPGFQYVVDKDSEMEKNLVKQVMEAAMLAVCQKLDESKKSTVPMEDASSNEHVSEGDDSPYANLQHLNRRERFAVINMRLEEARLKKEAETAKFLVQQQQDIQGAENTVHFLQSDRAGKQSDRVDHGSDRITTQSDRIGFSAENLAAAGVATDMSISCIVFERFFM